MENLPEFQGGFIHSLQQNRMLSRELELDAFNNTRSPDNTHLKFAYIQMLEVFPYEDFELLQKSLEHLFPDLNNNSALEFNDFFDELKNSLSARFFTPIGWIYREKEPLGPFETSQLSTLPAGVDRIKVDLYKILPSTIVIRFHVYLNETATITFNNLQKEKYLPEERVDSIFLKEKEVGITTWSSERSMQNAIGGWLQKLRQDIEYQLEPYLSGVFIGRTSKYAKLPAIEIYELAGDFASKDEFDDLADKMRSWWRSFDFQIDQSFYCHNDVVFNFAHKSAMGEFPVAHRVVELPEIYKNKSLGQNPATNFLSRILVPLAVIELLKNETEQIKKFRSIIYTNLSKKKSIFSKN